MRSSHYSSDTWRTFTRSHVASSNNNDKQEKEKERKKKRKWKRRERETGGGRYGDHPSRIFRDSPEFWGLEGLSRKNMRSFGTLDCSEFRNLSRICPDLTSRCVAVQTVDPNAVDYFDVFACHRCVLLSSKCTKSIFRHPAGGTWTLPQTP